MVQTTQLLTHRRLVSLITITHSGLSVAPQDSIELFVEQHDSSKVVVEPSASGKGGCEFFVIHSLIGHSANSIWAVCSKLEIFSDDIIYKAWSLHKDMLQIIKLDTSVRRVHVTNRLIGMSTDNHSSNFCTGGTEFLLRRADGYPPIQS